MLRVKGREFVCADKGNLKPTLSSAPDEKTPIAVLAGNGLGTQAPHVRLRGAGRAGRDLPTQLVVEKLEAETAYKREKAAEARFRREREQGKSVSREALTRMLVRIGSTLRESAESLPANLAREFDTELRPSVIAKAEGFVADWLDETANALLALEQSDGEGDKT